MSIFLIALWLATLTLFVGFRAKATKSRPDRVPARRLPRRSPSARSAYGRRPALPIRF